MIKRLGGLLADTLLPVAAGIGLTAGFPPYGQKTLAFFSMVAAVGLFATASTRLRAFWRGWLFGFAHFVTGIYWVFISTHVYGGASVPVAVALVVLLAAYLALYPAIAVALVAWAAPLRVHAGRVLILLLIPASWMLAELLRGLVLGGFAWLATGYAFIDTQLSDFGPLIGVHGMTFLVWALATAIWSAFGEPRQVRLVGIASIMLGVGVISVVPSPGRWTEPMNQQLRVALVQGNVAQAQKWNPDQRAPIERLYRELTNAALHTRLIIWPEVAVTRPYEELRDGYLRRLGDVAKANGSTVLLGALHRDTEDGQTYNTAVMVGQDEGMYRKRHLVPFGEYFPVPSVLRPLLDVLNLPYSDLAAGARDQPALSIDGLPLAISICFEDLFGHVIRRDAAQAGVLVNITNDAWFDDSSAPYQHLQIARMRSLETGRPLLRVAGTGISAVTDARGRLLVTSPKDELDVIAIPVTPYSGRTPYMWFGDWPLWLVGFLFVMWSWLVARGRLAPPPTPY